MSRHIPFVLSVARHWRTKSKRDPSTSARNVNTPSAKAGGFPLRLKAESVGHTANRRVPSPLAGEGQGEGHRRQRRFAAQPLIPTFSHKGRRSKNKLPAKAGGFTDLLSGTLKRQAEYQPRSKERGVALLIALLILAFGASLSSAMLWERNLATSRSALLIAQRQAWQYNLGAEAWARQILRRSSNKNDTLNSAWAQKLPPLPIQGGALTGGIQDLEGRFNLNNLIGADGKLDKMAFAALKRLLAALQIPPAIANAIADWEDPDDEMRSPGGAETGYYSSLDPLYAPANAPFASVATLRLVKGITPKIYARLAPFVCALPVPTPINVNTARAPVIAAIVPGISLGRAKELVGQRGKKGYASVAAFQQMARRKIQFPLTLKSSFFLLAVTTHLGDTRLSLYSVIYRDANGYTRPLTRSLTPIQ
jgi:general secretion pathway protein K